MSRKLVFVAVFLAVLPVLMVAVKARGDDPPKIAGKKAAALQKLQKESEDVLDPFAGADDDKPKEAKPALKPQVDAPKAKVNRERPQGDLAKPKPSPEPVLHGGEKAILKALKQKTTLDFVETPLKDVVDYLSEMHHIPILIDSSALKEAGVDARSQITCKLSGISLQSALEIMLDEIQLKWTIHHDVLMITSPAKAESDEFMYTKSYDVTDLLASRLDFEVQNPLAPVTEAPIESLVNGSNPAPHPIKGRFGSVSHNIQPVVYDIQPLEDAVTNLVATKTWVDNGGTGVISGHDGLLFISQTREVHTKVEQFLADFRARRQARPTLSVELHWLWLNAKQREHLLAGREKSSDGQISLTVDPQRLRQIAREVPGFHGQVACLNGLGTAIAAGDRRSIIISEIPVIGDAVGYQPVISVPNVGVTAQVRPTFVPDKTATLDIVSIITRWGPSRKPAIIGAAWPTEKRVISSNPGRPSTSVQNANHGDGQAVLGAASFIGAPPQAQNANNNGGPAMPPPPAAPSMTTHSTQGGSGSCPVDRPIMPTQQIGTTLRVPLGKPVIVGSITFASSEDAGLGAAAEDAVEVYLIATTSIVRDAAK